MTVIDLEEEREKANKKHRYACPECHMMGKYCPDWIFKISPNSKEFKKLTIEEKLEWLHHTSPTQDDLCF